MTNKKRALAWFFVCLLAPALTAQPTQDGLRPLAAEAPKSLLATSIGDAEVELLVQGFWGLSLKSFGSLSSGGGAGAYNPTPLLFQQQPDLYLLLSLNEVWQFETSVTDDASQASFSLAFVNNRDGPVREVCVGNKDISFPAYPFLDLGQPPGAFGVMGRFAWPEQGLAAQAMLRWDNLSRRSRRFSGSSERSSSIVAIDQWLRGRSFVLPGSPPFTELALDEYVNGLPRRLGPEEYSLDSSSGYLVLRRASQTRLDASYLANGAPQTEVLYEKGEGNPYEAKNLYPVSLIGEDQSYLIRSRSSQLPSLDYEVQLVDGGLARVTRNGAGPAGAPEDFMEPFATVADWLYAAGPVGQPVYGAFPAMAPYELVVQGILHGEGSLSIEPGAVAGSIRVIRDGLPTGDFNYDSSTGRLELYPPPRPAEDILVEYSLYDSQREAGGLSFAAGLSYLALSGIDLHAALGGRLPIPDAGGGQTGQHPSWLGLSLSAASTNRSPAAEAAPSAGLDWRLAMHGRYSQADAARAWSPIELRPSSGLLSTFLPVEGYDPLDPDRPELGTEAAPGLLSGWKEFYASVGMGGSQPLALAVAFSAAGSDLSLIHYPRAFSLGGHRRLSLFIRAEALDADPGAQLRIELGGDQPGLILELPLDGLVAYTDQWLRVEVSLDAVLPSARLLHASGAELPLAISIDVQSTNQAVHEARITYSGIQSGRVLLADLWLLEPYDGYGFYLDTAMRLPPSGSLGLYLETAWYGRIEQAEGDHPEAGLAGSLAGGLEVGPLTLSGRVAPRLADDYHDLGLGYEWRLAGAEGPSLSQSFYRNAQAAQFGHQLNLGWRAPDWAWVFSFSNTDQANSFRRQWQSALTAGSWLSLGLRLSEQRDQGVYGQLDFASSWLAGWPWLFDMESSPTARRQSGLDLKLGSAASLKLSAAYLYQPQAGSPASLNGAVQLPLSFSLPGKAAGLGPLRMNLGYERLVLGREAVLADAFYQDWQAWGGHLAGAWPYLGSLPLLEYFDDDLAPAFAQASLGLEQAQYWSDSSLSLQRRGGLGLLDLWLPSRLSLAWRRSLERSMDSVTDQSSLRLGLAANAINLFSAQGVQPTFSAYELDEYSWRLGLTLAWLDDGLVLPGIDFDTRMNLYDSSNGGLGLGLKHSWQDSRAGSSWSHAAQFNLSQRRRLTWLGGLINPLVLGREEAAAKPVDGDTQVVSAWLDQLASSTPVMRDIWSLEAGWSKRRPELQPELRLRQAYESRYNLGGSLSAAAKLAVDQSLRNIEGYAVLGFGYELAIELRILF